jgi:hypothetical protein
MTPPPRSREFSPGERSEAALYLGELQPGTRVYVEEWDGARWRFVFGDDCQHARNGLSRVRNGARFRVRLIRTVH